MKRISLFALLFLGVILAGCSTQAPQESEENTDISIGTTFFPLQDLTEKIAGETANVIPAVPENTDPHAFRLSPRDLAAFEDIDAYVALGVEFEAFEEDITSSLSDDVMIIHAGEEVKLLSLDQNHEHAEHEEHTEEENHSEKGVDPHIWLSPENMQVMAKTITDNLSTTYPKHEERFRNNFAEVNDSLENLHQSFRDNLNNCEKDTVLVNHNAFSYLAEAYGFSTITVSGLRPESEPTPQQLSHLIEEAQRHNLTHIFYEELADPRIVETIAAEADLEVLELNPAAGTKNPNEDYVSIMRENLNNLEIALHCR